MSAASSLDLLYSEQLTHPEGVEGYEGLPADSEVEDARKNKQEAAGCC